MRILHVIPGLKNASGPTQAALNLAKYAQADGHEVTLAYVSGRGTDPEQQVFGAFELRGFSYRFSKKWAYSPALFRFLRKNIRSYDIVHIHGVWLFPNLAVGLNAIFQKVPYIVRPAGSLDPLPLQMKGFKKRMYLSLIERPLINRAAAIHAVSENEAQNIRSLHFHPEVVTIPNGIDLEEYASKEPKASLRLSFKLQPEPVIILFMGRLHPIKNLEFLGRVFQQLLASGIGNAFLMIAGPDQHAYAKKLKQYYQELGIGTNCRFMGEVSGEEKIQLLQACDLFTLPSLTENFGFAALEALAAGLPTVVSAHTPWQVIQERQAGYWLPLEEAQFKEVFESLAQDQALRSRQSSHAIKLASEYNWPAINRRMVKFYEKIISGRTRE